MHWAFRLQREIGRAMRRQHDSRENRNGYRVPVEQSHVAAHPEIREERHREIALGIERNAARQVARRRAEKDGQKKIGKHENEIPEPLPKAIVDVAADFERDPAQNQAPQNQKEREVIAGKSRGQQPREYREQGSAETDEPHFMPCPERSDRSDDLPAFLGSFGDKPVEHSSAEVAAVQNHVDDEHEADDARTMSRSYQHLLSHARQLQLLSFGTVADLATDQAEKEQTEHKIEAGEADQREDRVAAAHYFAVAIARAKQSVDQPRLASQFGGHPTQSVGDVGKGKRQHQHPEQPGAGFQSAAPILESWQSPSGR